MMRGLMKSRMRVRMWKSENFVVLREAQRIQLQLRYILGFYKLHSLFVESHLHEYNVFFDIWIVRSLKKSAFRNIFKEEGKENLADTRSAEKTKKKYLDNIHSTSSFDIKGDQNKLSQSNSSLICYNPKSKEHLKRPIWINRIFLNSNLVWMKLLSV